MRCTVRGLRTTSSPWSRSAVRVYCSIASVSSPSRTTNWPLWPASAAGDDEAPRAARVADPELDDRRVGVERHPQRLQARVRRRGRAPGELVAHHAAVAVERGGEMADRGDARRSEHLVPAEGVTGH